MIHTREYETELFEALASGRKSFVKIENDPELLVGDFIAINEVADVPQYTEPDDYVATLIEPTGRCCLMEVTYIEMANDNKIMLASVKPCGIGNSEARSMAYNRDIYKAPVYNRTREASYL